MQSDVTRKEWRNARQSGVNVYPDKGCPNTELDYANLPKLTTKGIQVALLFLFFHKRLCGPSC